MGTRLKGEIVKSYDTHRHQIKIRDSMFFKQVIEPFVSPFYDIGDYIWAKLAVLIFAASFEFTTGLFENTTSILGNPAVSCCYRFVGKKYLHTEISTENLERPDIFEAYYF